MKKLPYMPSLTIALAFTVISGCSMQPKLTEDQVMSQYPQVQALESALIQARAANAELLAPESYKKTSQSLEDAIAAAQSGNTMKAENAANNGMELITMLNTKTENSRETMSEILEVRERAYAAGAATLQKDAIAELDDDLKNAAALFEKGNEEKAKKIRPKLLASYHDLELNTLKEGSLDLAKSAIANAKEEGAAKLAPKTFARATEQMRLANTILDADRTQTMKAETYAANAKWLAEQSASIAETAKDFDRRDYSVEDIVLWHQQQLEVINQPLDIKLPFNLSSGKAALSLKDAIIAEQEASKMALAAEQAMTDKIAMTAQVSQEELKMQQDELNKDDKYNKKFDMVQGIFKANEAKVYRQGQNVLISAHGFQFPSGKSETQTKNFPLMNKIIQAIKMFPNASIEVVGHTDSMGNEATNQTLSDERAANVAKFLIEIGEIPEAKVTSRGFGENRPVATNETVAGRAENRRVEIVILNK